MDTKNASNQFKINSLVFRNTLEQIFEKYSRLDDGGMELNLQTMSMKDVEHCMDSTKTKLSKLELSKLKLESSRLEVYEYDGADKSNVGVNHSLMQHEADSSLWSYGIDNSQQTLNSTEATQSSLHGTLHQPEDEDEELEQTLSSQGSSLQDLYPTMIGQIGEVWRRQHLSEAASSVLRRYRRMRLHTNRSNLTNRTLNNTVTSVRSVHRNLNKTLLNNHKSTLQRVSGNASSTKTSNKTPTQSPLHTIANLQLQSPRKEPDSVRREQHCPILVMDIPSFCSGVSPRYACSEPAETLLNQTFTVTETSQPKKHHAEQPTPLAFSPVRLSHSVMGGSMSPYQKSLSSGVNLTTVNPAYKINTSTVSEDSCVYLSPTRPGSFRARLLNMESHRSSFKTHTKSPKTLSEEWHTRVPVELRYHPPSPTSSHQCSPRKLNIPNSSPLKLRPTLSAAKPEEPVRQRRLSLDSRLKSRSHHPSSTQLEDEFQKLYHKFICQAKSADLHGPSCRVCVRISEPSRGHCSSALAALALSPHHSLMRKRHRELEQDISPQSKRSRDEYSIYSPGSLRQTKAMLRQHYRSRSSGLLSSTTMECPADSLTCSPWSARMSHGYRAQPPPSSNIYLRRYEGIQLSQHSPVWREKYNRFVAMQDMSPRTAEWQSGCSPSVSRRRLLYK